MASQGARGSGRRRRSKFDPNRWANSIPSKRTNVLLLGVSYPCVKSQIKAADLSSSVQLLHPQESVEQAVELVRRNILTEMDGRDLARCLAIEASNETHAYTVSMEHGAIYGPRHLTANFNRHSFCREMRKSWSPKIKFRQIILDYFWIPTGSWAMTHWTRNFFTTTLPNLVRENLLDTSTGEGVVFLPFCVHCIAQIVAAQNELAKYYDISFLYQHELSQNALWQATSSISPSAMQLWLGKNIHQEEFYCTFGLKDILNGVMDDAYVRKDDLLQILSGIENFDKVRMIKMKVRTPTSKRSRCEEKKDDDTFSDQTIRNGPFIGLKEHTVRGIYQVTHVKKTLKAKRNQNLHDDYAPLSPQPKKSKPKNKISKPRKKLSQRIEIIEHVNEKKEKNDKAKQKVPESDTVTKQKVQSTPTEKKTVSKPVKVTLITNNDEPSKPVTKSSLLKNDDNDESATTESTEFSIKDASVSFQSSNKIFHVEPPSKSTIQISQDCTNGRDSKCTFQLQPPKKVASRPRIWAGSGNYDSHVYRCSTQKEGTTEIYQREMMLQKIRKIAKDANVNYPCPNDYLPPVIFKNIQERIQLDKTPTSDNASSHSNFSIESTNEIHSNHDMALLLLDIRKFKLEEQQNRYKNYRKQTPQQAKMKKISAQHESAGNANIKNSTAIKKNQDYYIIDESDLIESDADFVKETFKELPGQNKKKRAHPKHEIIRNNETNKKKLLIIDEDPDCYIIQVIKHTEQRRQPLKKRKRTNLLIEKDEISRVPQLTVRKRGENNYSSYDDHLYAEKAAPEEIGQTKATNSSLFFKNPIVPIASNVKQKNTELKNAVKSSIRTKKSRASFSDPICNYHSKAKTKKLSKKTLHTQLSNETSNIFHSLEERNVFKKTEYKQDVYSPPGSGLAFEEAFEHMERNSRLLTPRNVPSIISRIPNDKKKMKVRKSTSKKKEKRILWNVNTIRGNMNGFASEIYDNDAYVDLISQQVTTPKNYIEHAQSQNRQISLISMRAGPSLNHMNEDMNAYRLNTQNSLGMQSTLNSALSRSQFCKGIKRNMLVDPLHCGILCQKDISTEFLRASPLLNPLISANTNISSPRLIPRQHMPSIPDGLLIGFDQGNTVHCMNPFSHV